MRKRRQKLPTPDAQWKDASKRYSAFAPRMDSGMVTRFEQANYRKTEKYGIFARIQNAWSRAFKRVNPEDTSMQGSAGAAAPSAVRFQLYTLRYERRQVIMDCRQMYDDDARCRRSVNKFAREAVRNGVTILVNAGGRGTTGQRARVAKYCAERVQKLVNKEIESWSRMLVVEGDSFLQFGVVDNEIVEIKRMPTTSMERLTNDADEFFDPLHAFAQVDTQTDEELTTFPLWSIHHARWNHIDGERYGRSELYAGRRLRRILELTEDAQVRRRIARAPIRRLWNIGTADKPGQPDHITKFKEENGFVEGEREALDPMEVGRDTFGNGLITATTLQGDPNVHQIDDLRYLQNVYTSAALPTPGPLYNLDAETVNRDVLGDLRAEWLKETKVLSEVIEEAVRAAMDLYLLLQGILPETVDYSIRFSESSIETPGEIIDRVISARQNVVGHGPMAQAEPLVSLRRAVQMLAEFHNVEDVDEEYAQILREISELRASEETRLATTRPDPAKEPGGEDKTRAQTKRDNKNLLVDLNQYMTRNPSYRNGSTRKTTEDAMPLP